MNPQTGDILSMVTYPDYNLNTPFTPNSSIDTGNWDSLDSNAKTGLLYQMWNNTAVQNTYEPGSTFKFITAGAALEENIVGPDNPTDFYCEGYQVVDGITINDWTYPRSHGYESLREAFANSCNPAFIQLGQKIGAPTLYKYYKAFGLFDSTNSGLYGESNSIFLPLSEARANSVDLATMSFGQRFTITPLQLITAVSAIANEGTLMKPNIIKSIKDPSTGSITTVQPTPVRQVISKETAATMMDIAQYEVTNGTGRYASVTGYSVAGKSGTSEPIYSDKEKGYVASFIGLSPVVNTQVVVLVILYNPQGDSHQGGTIAGPVVSQILTEVLPYLEVTSNSPTSSSTGSSKTTVSLPDVRNKSIAEARSALSNFHIRITGNEDESSTIITDQVPKPGVSLFNNSDVFLYTKNNNDRILVSVPDLSGMSEDQAINATSAKSLNIIVNGNGVVISQSVAAGTEVEQGTVVTVNLQPKLNGGY